MPKSKLDIKEKLEEFKALAEENIFESVISFIDNGYDNGWSDLEMSAVLKGLNGYGNGKKFNTISAIKYLLDDNNHDLAYKLFNLTKKNLLVDLYFTATTGEDIENNQEYVKCCLFLGSDFSVPLRDSNNKIMKPIERNEFLRRVLSHVAIGYADSVDRYVAQGNEEEVDFYRNKVSLFKENFDEECSDFYKNIFKERHVGIVDEDLRGGNHMFQRSIVRIKGEYEKIRLLEAENLEYLKRRDEIKSPLILTAPILLTATAITASLLTVPATIAVASTVGSVIAVASASNVCGRSNSKG
ncbi:MAG: hypothetical protein ACJA0S_000184 [Rickettsiales bacterium]|jgi:hypothetical protein